ncbi:hypothetical protein HOY80DRAFT_985979 [Tuber brumale]|nr:hypothetical protein HOY80DRAFT_985979 [Tuber brumale]
MKGFKRAGCICFRHIILAIANSGKCRAISPGNSCYISPLADGLILIPSQLHYAVLMKVILLVATGLQRVDDTVLQYGTCRVGHRYCTPLFAVVGLQF